MLGCHHSPPPLCLRRALQASGRESGGRAAGQAPRAKQALGLVAWGLPRASRWLMICDRPYRVRLAGTACTHSTAAGGRSCGACRARAASCGWQLRAQAAAAGSQDSRRGRGRRGSRGAHDGGGRHAQLRWQLGHKGAADLRLLLVLLRHGCCCRSSAEKSCGEKSQECTPCAGGRRWAAAVSGGGGGGDQCGACMHVPGRDSSCSGYHLSAVQAATALLQSSGAAGGCAHL